MFLVSSGAYPLGKSTCVLGFCPLALNWSTRELATYLPTPLALSGSLRCVWIGSIFRCCFGWFSPISNNIQSDNIHLLQLTEGRPPGQWRHWAKQWPAKKKQRHASGGSWSSSRNSSKAQEVGGKTPGAALPPLQRMLGARTWKCLSKQTRVSDDSTAPTSLYRL